MSNIKNVTLSGDEIEVIISGQYCDIRNDGTDVIYASTMPGIIAGADGVISIPVGSAVILQDVRGNVYVKGTGAASIVGTDSGQPVFKCAPTSGGSGQDDVARQAINAHAGNADMHVNADEKAAWNAINYSNPNLLINPDFRVNQRGQSSYSTGYTVDLWKSTNLTVNVTSDGLQLEQTDSSKAGQLIQEIELDYSALAGRDVTISITAAEGTTLCATGKIPEALSADTLVARAQSADTNYKADFHATSTGYYVAIRIVGSSPVIKNVKLEVGNVATPFCPPEPATETAKCQRYYQIRSTGDVEEVDLRPSMRATPTIKQLADGYAYSAEI